MVPLPAVPAAHAPEVDAGGRVPPCAAGAAADEATQPDAPEMAAPKDRVSRPEDAIEELVRPEAPEVATPEPRGSSPEVVAGELTQPRVPEVATRGAPQPALDADNRAPGFGQLRLNFEALRKRKGPPSCSGDAYRPLKQRKYIAVDE
nr:predicted GPI-anchored protein 58 [Aegilops tauschii subsp. strangulata]